MAAAGVEAKGRGAGARHIVGAGRIGAAGAFDDKFRPATDPVRRSAASGAPSGRRVDNPGHGAAPAAPGTFHFTGHRRSTCTKDAP